MIDLTSLSMLLVAACGDDSTPGNNTANCEGVTCSDRGTCVIQDGEAICDCDVGYDGEDCGECYPGYHDDGSGVCLLDQTCQPNSCSTHGSCDDSSGAVVCNCDAGYTGDHCEQCAAGYQDNDNDGTCEPNCATAASEGLECGEYNECDDSSGTAVCVCDDGFQDNDGDGDCQPSCAYLELIGQGCGDHATCDDSTGSPVCSCVIGYQHENEVCVWAEDRPANPNFLTYDAWVTTIAAALYPSDTGYADGGAGLLNENAVCDGGAISQSFEMPAYEYAEPLTLDLAVWRKYSNGDCNNVQMAMGINGGYQLPRTSVWNTQWEEFTYCLGERGYGGNVELAFFPVGDCADCGGSTYSIPSFKIDNVIIASDSNNICPALGEVRNGDFEEDLAGWTAEASPTYPSVAEALTGVGVGNSTGGHLAVSQRCGYAFLEGRFSVPLNQTMSTPALDISYNGTADTVAHMRLESLDFGDLAGSGGWETRRYCLTEGFKGLVPMIQVRNQDFGSGSCTDPVTWDYVLDDLTVVSDAGCPTEALLIDGGFENIDSTPSLSYQWRTYTTYDKGIAERVINSGQARTGNVALNLTVQGPCSGPGASALFTVPDPQGGEGPALKFWYKFPSPTNAVFYSKPGDGALPQVSDWTEVTVCLDSAEAGMVKNFSFLTNGGGGLCSATYADEVIWIDDVEATTDPSCP